MKLRLLNSSDRLNIEKPFSTENSSTSASLSKQSTTIMGGKSKQRVTCKLDYKLLFVVSVLFALVVLLCVY